LHDGFYFRFALGGAPVFGKVKPKTSAGEIAVDADVSAFAALSELAFGGSPMPGLVLGGGIYGASLSGIEYKGKFAGATRTYESDAAIVSMLGPFIDFYPNPQQGFHAQAAIAFSIVSADQGKYNATYGDSFPPDNYAGTGFGLMLGAGYEWWIGEQWSLGVLGRVQYTSATLKANSNLYDDADFSAWIPGVLVDITYH
jgi:hypothetical protein